MTGSYLLVGNPTAQSGKARSRISSVLQKLSDRGVKVVFLATEPEGRTVQAVQAALDEGDFELVIYLGGDGTFSEVAKGILAAKQIRPLGMLPSGTGNNQGRSFGIKSDPSAIDENLDIIQAGHLTQLDVGLIELLDGNGGTVESSFFFDSAGWGLQADIVTVRNSDRSWVEQIPFLRDIYRDQAVYVGATLNRFFGSFIEPMKFDAAIVADGVQYNYSGLTDAIVNATAVYAGWWILDRSSEPDDGRFEFVPLQGRRDGISKMLRDFATVGIGQEQLNLLGLTHSVGFSGSTFELRFSRPGKEAIASQVDGDVWLPGNHFRVTVLPNRLPAITPKGFVPPWKETARR